ncbi:hypothetical protein QBC32DRAFT_220943, partial [Pseudoneurospora amorphoporcata]
NFTYFRINIKVTPKLDDVEIYIDLRVVKTIIGRPFLNIFEYTISTDFTIRIKGVGGKLIKLTKWVIFTFYLLSKDLKGKPTLFKIRAIS